MSTPTEYQILRQRHDRLREGIAALADSWIAVPIQDALTSWMVAGVELRALLDQEDA